MVLNDRLLREWGLKHVIPFTSLNINPASLDLTLGGEIIDLLTDEKKELDFDNDLILSPGMAILASTREYIEMPEDCAGTIYLKSSLARKGLDHALAGWIDPGFHGEITLELHAHRLIGLRRGQRICQLVLNRMEEIPLVSYKVTGRYNMQTGPTKAR